MASPAGDDPTHGSGLEQYRVAGGAAGLYYVPDFVDEDTAAQLLRHVYVSSSLIVVREPNAMDPQSCGCFAVVPTRI